MNVRTKWKYSTCTKCTRYLRRRKKTGSFSLLSAWTDNKVQNIFVKNIFGKMENDIGRWGAKTVHRTEQVWNMNRAEKWRRIQTERRLDIFIGNSKPKSAHEQGVIKYRFFFVKWIHVFMSMSFITIHRHTVRKNGWGVLELPFWCQWKIHREQMWNTHKHTHTPTSAKAFNLKFCIRNL